MSIQPVSNTTNNINVNNNDNSAVKDTESKTSRQYQATSTSTESPSSSLQGRVHVDDAPKKRRGRLAKIRSLGVSIGGKKGSPISSPVQSPTPSPVQSPTPSPVQSPVPRRRGLKAIKSDGVKLKSNKAQESAIPQIDDMHSFIRVIRDYVSLIPKKAHSSLFQADERVMKGISQFIQKQHGGWISQAIANNEGVKTTIETLLNRYADPSNEGNKQIANECAKELFRSITEAVAVSLSSQENPMPDELKEIFLIMCDEAKCRFPGVNSWEAVVIKVFFSQCIVPALTLNSESRHDIQAFSEIKEMLSVYLETLHEEPAQLAPLLPLFDINFEQVQQAINNQLSLFEGGATPIQAFLRGNEKDELLIRTYGQHVAGSWMRSTLLENPLINKKIKELIGLIEKNNNLVPEDLKLKWGKEMFSVFCNGIVRSQNPMPDAFRRLFQELNSGVKQRLPEVDSEKLVFTAFFLRFFAPILVFEGRGTPIESRRVKISSCIQTYINQELDRIPQDLVQALLNPTEQNNTTS